MNEISGSPVRTSLLLHGHGAHMFMCGRLCTRHIRSLTHTVVVSSCVQQRYSSRPAEGRCIATNRNINRSSILKWVKPSASVLVLLLGLGYITVIWHFTLLWSHYNKISRVPLPPRLANYLQNFKMARIVLLLKIPYKQCSLGSMQN